MRYLNDMKKLCTPAFVYLSISVLTILVIALQNIGNTNKYCIGSFTCNVSNTFFIFLFKTVYIVFWTFILNVLCKAGYKEISWFLVLLPYMLLFIIIGLLLLNNGVRRNSL